MTLKILIIGGGVFGAAAALELVTRGHRVTLLDPGPLPHPKASSTDISKVIRPDYGADDFYTDLMMESLRGWDRWNREWARPLYHETGFTVLSRSAMEPGGFEYESLQRLIARGIAVEQLNADVLSKRFPEWNADLYPDGYFNPRAGWAESGAVVSALIELAQSRGAQIVEMAEFESLIERGSHVVGVRTRGGAEYFAEWVVMAAGAWTPVLLPELSTMMKPIGQPVVHLRAPDATRFRPPNFSAWAADISRTGWYGFPALEDGTFKIGHHGPGFIADPLGPLEVPAEHIERVREFVTETFPSLAHAPVISTRLCLYCDSWDGDFYLCRHPDRPGLVVSAGGSGHAFKFAPMIGPIVSDAIEGRENPWAGRFDWRAAGDIGAEHARFTKS